MSTNPYTQVQTKGENGAQTLQRQKHKIGQEGELQTQQR